MIKNIDLKLNSEASGSHPAHSRYSYRSFSWLNNVPDTAVLVLLLELHLNLRNSADITVSWLVGLLVRQPNYMKNY